MSMEDVGMMISTIKTTADCPRAVANFKVKNKKLRTELSLVVSRGVYPSGRCCTAITPPEAEKYPVYELDFLMDNGNQINENIKGFKILLSDQTSSSIFQLDKFNTEGSGLEIDLREGGYRKYRLKMFEEVHLEEDPKFPCRIYSFPRKLIYSDTIPNH